jgi:glutamine synthetase
MMKHLLFTACILSAAIVACTDQPNSTLVKANEAHLEALEIAENLEQKLKTYQESGDHNAATLEKADSIQSLVSQWEEAMIEVPGFAHEHGAGHHEHKPAPKMTDESMLDYQVNAKLVIEELARETDLILAKETEK